MTIGRSPTTIRNCPALLVSDFRLFNYALGSSQRDLVSTPLVCPPTGVQGVCQQVGSVSVPQQDTPTFSLFLNTLWSPIIFDAQSNYIVQVPDEMYSFRKVGANANWQGYVVSKEAFEMLRSRPLTWQVPERRDISASIRARSYCHVWARKINKHHDQSGRSVHFATLVF